MHAFGWLRQPSSVAQFLRDLSETFTPPPGLPGPMVATVDEAVKRVEAAFWRRYNARPEMQEKLAGKDRVLQLSFTDAPAENHWFHLVDGKLGEVQKATHPKPDATVTTSTKDLFAILNGETKALQAYMMGRVKVKASFADLFFAKSLFGL